MKTLQIRAFFLVCILLVVGLVYWDGYYQVQQSHRYSIKVPAAGPLLIVMALYLMMFPTRTGKPATANERRDMWIVMAIGAAADLVNLYQIDPSMFGR